jgi:hypothetical protein
VYFSDDEGRTWYNWSQLAPPWYRHYWSPVVPLSRTLLCILTALWATGPLPAQAPDADVPKVLDRYRLFRPADKDLAIFQLDWAPTLKEARARAAKEQRPILLLVVTNSYGNLFSGHC